MIPIVIKEIKYYISLIGKNSLCNKCKDRTPHISSLYFILCWRCTGVVSGVVIGLIIRTIYQIELDIILRVLCFTPLVLDGYLSYSKYPYTSSNTKRLITGLLAGFVIT